MTKYDKGWIVCQLMIEQSDSTNPQSLRGGGRNPEFKIAPNCCSNFRSKEVDRPIGGLERFFNLFFVKNTTSANDDLDWPRPPNTV
jgi:hypothetical protein